MNQVNRPILILGAARSGTTMLRSLLGRHPAIAVVPFEINHIWRYGNERVSNDELDPTGLSKHTLEFIHKQFIELSQSVQGQRILEKTCANTLRPEYVLSVFPDCQIIHIIRDGRDVASSARIRWSAPPESYSYLLKKSRGITAKDLPFLAYRCFKNRLQRAVRGMDHAVTWGPRFAGIDSLVRTHSLIEVCGIQWKKSVETCLAATETLPSTKALHIRYEELVQDPAKGFKEIAEFLEVPFTDEFRMTVMNTVSSNSIGKWRESLSENDQLLLEKHISELLGRLGYK